MSADRSVHTDALATLGTILEGECGRDAIHLAVIPMIAGEDLWPGYKIGILDGKANMKAKTLGIVDPFLTERVKIGQKFWMVILPRQITSLRHVWAHPDIPNIADPIDPVVNTDLEASRAWIANFASLLDQTPNRLMGAAEDWLNNDDYTCDNSETYKDHWDKFPEFWDHYEVVTGKRVERSKRKSFFTCSC